MTRSKIKTRFLMLAAWYFFSPGSALAADWNPSGFYNSFQLAVDPKTQIVTGYYMSQTGMGPDGGPMFSCMFYVTGKREGERASIQAYYPMDKKPRAVILGEMKFSPPDSVWLKLQELPAGGMACSEVKEGTEMTRESGGGDWMEIRVVKAKKAHFFDRPGADAPRKSYVVQDDGIQVMETRPGWVLATFEGKSKGWLREKDLYPK
jgi:hypothetical protein